MLVDAVIPDHVRLGVIRGFKPPAPDLARVLATAAGDEFHDGSTGIEVDVMYWDPAWLEDRLAAVIDRHEAADAYTTAFWFTVRHARPLHDPTGWFGELMAKAGSPYPEELRRHIVAKNTAVIRQTQSSYRHQVEKAIARGDRVSVNHRVAVLLAAYLDVVFAANRALHPGEKRLLDAIERDGLRHPAGMRKDVEAVVNAVCGDPAELVRRIDTLAEGLEGFAAAELARD